MKHFVLCASLAAGAALGGCAQLNRTSGPPLELASQVDRYQPTVAEIEERLTLPAEPAGAGLDAESAAALAEFAAFYRAEGDSPLVVAAPTGGANEPDAAALAARARVRLAEAGVPPTAILAAAYDAQSDNDPLVLRFTRLQAVAPDCPSIAASDITANVHRPWARFGCAQAANLAAMIADPAHLVAPAASTPIDAARRSAVLSLYRQGQPTHAERSEDERGAVSDVAR